MELENFIKQEENEQECVIKPINFRQLMDDDDENNSDNN